MASVAEKLQALIEGKELTVVPASVDPAVTDPVVNDQEQNQLPIDPTEVEAPPVSIENPLSVDPIVPPEEQGKENKAGEKKVDEEFGLEDGLVVESYEIRGEKVSAEAVIKQAKSMFPNQKLNAEHIAKAKQVILDNKDKLEEMAMDKVSHPKHGDLTWENNKGTHVIKKGDREVFSGTHEEVAKRWQAIKKSINEEVALDEEADAELLEALRLVSKHGDGQHTAKVYKDTEWDEHRVKFYKDGVHQKDADYHTDDLEDAKGTAESHIKRMTEEAEVVAEELLATDANLSEEFKATAKEIFESEIAKRVAIIESEIEEKYVAKLTTIIEEINVEKQEYITNLSEKIDTFLDSVSDQWVVEQKSILEANAKAEISESLISGMKSLFESHGIQVPVSERNIMAEMEASIESLKEQVNQLTNSLSESNEVNKELKFSKIINESVKGMTELDQSRLKTLIENLTFETEENLIEKIDLLKESMFSNKNTSEEKNQSSLITESAAQPNGRTPRMEAYLKALQGRK